MEMHKTEIAANRGMYEALVEKYKVYRIKDLFDLSVTEFINCPNDFVQTLIRSSIQTSSAESKQDAAAAQLAEELRKMEANR